MRTFLTYLKLEWKRACKSIPYFIGGAIVLTVLLGTIAFSASKMLYQGKVLGQIQVGVVLPEGDPLAKQVVTMLGSLDSVESLCQFNYMELEEGKEQLRRGEIYALMKVPEDFVKGIMNGTNTPIQIIFPKNAGMESVVFQELTEAGARTLGIAQAAIYAADDFCYVNQMVDSISQVEADLNRIFMDYSLSRSVYFRDVKVSATGDISVADYYGISAAVLFLLLCGIPAARFLIPVTPVFAQKLKSVGIGSFQIVAVRIFSVMTLLLLVSSFMVFSAISMGKMEFSISLLAGWLLVALACGTLIVFCYQLSGSLITGVMLLFLATVTMVFLSGGFIPSVFLPEEISKIGAVLPTTLMIDVIKGMLTEFDLLAAGKLLLMQIALYVAASVVRRQNG